MKMEKEREREREISGNRKGEEKWKVHFFRPFGEPFGRVNISRTHGKLVHHTCRKEQVGFEKEKPNSFSFYLLNLGAMFCVQQGQQGG